MFCYLVLKLLVPTAGKYIKNSLVKQDLYLNE